MSLFKVNQIQISSTTNSIQIIQIVITLTRTEQRITIVTMFLNVTASDRVIIADVKVMHEDSYRPSKYCVMHFIAILFTVTLYFY